MTEARTLARSPQDRCSLVEAKPETGRLHQIRRHLPHLAHPLIGDVRHGDGRVNRHYREAWSLHRLALHAVRLRFPHPLVEGCRVDVRAPLPEDLRATFDALGLADALAAYDVAMLTA